MLKPKTEVNIGQNLIFQWVVTMGYLRHHPPWRSRAPQGLPFRWAGLLPLMEVHPWSPITFITTENSVTGTGSMCRRKTLPSLWPVSDAERITSFTCRWNSRKIYLLIKDRNFILFKYYDKYELRSKPQNGMWFCGRNLDPVQPDLSLATA